MANNVILLYPGIIFSRELDALGQKIERMVETDVAG